MLTLTASDQHQLAAYSAQPSGSPKAGLVVVQEIFGVNSHIRSVADGYAKDGFLCVAPAIFDRAERGVELGYQQADMERGFGLKGAVTPGGDAGAVLLDVSAAVAWLRAQGVAKVGIVGYCFGGLISWLSAGKVAGIDAAVCYYGGGMPDAADVKAQCPVMAHFGDQDHWLPLDKVGQFHAANPQVSLNIYAANHGFNCDQRGSYNEAAAVAARAKSVAFFNQHLVG
jgi:carboxymethylenebutenolidase